MAIHDDWREAYNGVQAWSEEVPHRTCTTMAYNQLVMEAFPAFRVLLSDLERETRMRLAEPQAFAAEEPVTIPVVLRIGDVLLVCMPHHVHDDNR